MAIYTKILLQTHSLLEQQQDRHLPRYMLKWRQEQLLVMPSQQAQHIDLRGMENQQWLVACLKHSPVRLIRLDLALGETELRLWADACEQAKKPAFLRLPAGCALARQRSALSLWLKRLIGWSASAILLLTLSPVILGLVLLMLVYSPGPIFFRKWHVGERGKLFRLIEFRKDALPITPLKNWMHKYSLNKLPQLFNVLRGDMSLVGSRPYALSDAVRLSLEERRRLNALPGLLGV